jgi:hypothetical protein
MGVWRFVDRYRSRPASYLVYGVPPGRSFPPCGRHKPAFAANKATSLGGWPDCRACAPRGARPGPSGATPPCTHCTSPSMATLTDAVRGARQRGRRCAIRVHAGATALHAPGRGGIEIR